MGVVAGIVAGVLGAGAMMTIAWEHNPQGEFHGAAGIQWHNWLPIGVVWFVPIAALASFAFAASFAAIDHIARRRRREHDQRR